MEGEISTWDVASPFRSRKLSVLGKLSLLRLAEISYIFSKLIMPKCELNM